MAKRKKKTVRLYHFDPDNPSRKIWLDVPVHDGKKTIDALIHLTRELIRRSKRGIPYECVIAEGIKQYAKDNPSAFPHPVVFAYVIKSCIYLIDRWTRNGQPAHCFRYRHDFGELADTFDTVTKRTFEKRFDGHGFNLRIRPAKTGGHREYTPGRHHGAPGDSKPRISRGALGRAKRAGLLTMTPAAA